MYLISQFIFMCVFRTASREFKYYVSNHKVEEKKKNNTRQGDNKNFFNIKIVMFLWSGCKYMKMLLAIISMADFLCCIIHITHNTYDIHGSH